MRHRWLWWSVLLVLVALRLPALVQPAGGDQGLYAYAGDQMLQGAVPYLDTWDQKPPGVVFLYAALLSVWPHESVVLVADVLAAMAVVALLILIGRRRFSPAIGFGAAAVYLLFGDPNMQRLGGIYVRGQCEPFMALAVTGALALLASHDRRRWHLIGAGVLVAAAFWLKYNAIAYGLVLAVAVWVWHRDRALRPAGLLQELLWVGAGFIALCLIVLGWFWWHGGLGDLWLATIEYNLRYSEETYTGTGGPLWYLLTFPFERMRVDMIWFLGGIGALGLVASVRSNTSALVVLAWILSAALSIVINGQRDLPNYFVQAFPALALAAAVGLGAIWQRGPRVRWVVVALLCAAVWRVGADAPIAGMRFAGLPGLASNVAYDLDHWRGVTDRRTYLSRFRGAKHDTLDNHDLVQLVRETTTPGDEVYVFGFSGGSVGWLSGRRSPSRFFWSHPVLIEFASEVPGYGSAGVLADLQHRSPVLVVLQKEQWQSRDFFMQNAPLRTWLEAEYLQELESDMFVVWRRALPQYSPLAHAPQTMR